MKKTKDDPNMLPEYDFRGEIRGDEQNGMKKAPTSWSSSLM